MPEAGALLAVPEDPGELVRRFLMLQAARNWDAAIALVSDECLRQRYELFQQACHGEAALKYGYRSPDEARCDTTREFVRRMLRSAASDAGGTNPSAAAIPDNADCHVSVAGDDVVVTLATPFAATRTHYRTTRLPDGRRVISAMTSSHTSGQD
jgi:hypothetical protein